MRAPLNESRMLMDDLSHEYSESWRMFYDPQTMKCFEKCMSFFAEIDNRHLKIMGNNTPLIEYRTRLQMILSFLCNKGDLRRAASCVEEKLLTVAKTTGTDIAYSYLAQAIIKFLVINRKIFVRRVIDGPTSGEDGAYVI